MTQSETQERLKPCPFCGGQPTITTGHSAAIGARLFYNPSCATCNYDFQDGFYDIEDAIKAWNARHASGNNNRALWDEIYDAALLELCDPDVLEPDRANTLAWSIAIRATANPTNDDVTPRPPTVNTGRGRCIHNVPICGECEVRGVIVNVSDKEKARGDAATQMRTACVEKVKEMRDQHNRDYEYWKSVASNPDTDFGVLKFAAWAGEDDRVITALESLALDQVKQKEQSK